MHADKRSSRSQAECLHESYICIIIGIEYTDEGENHAAGSAVSMINKLCAWRHNMPPPMQVDNIFAVIRQVAVPACRLFKDISNKLTFDLLT